MKHVHCWNDLRQFGINILTGEACALGMRVLCDLDEQGVRLMREVFGLPDLECTLREEMRDLPPECGNQAARLRQRVRQFDRNMNSEGIASIMLPRSLFTDLAVVGCIINGCEVALLMDNGEVCGIEKGDVERYNLNTVYDTDKKDDVKTDDPFARLRKYHGIKREYGKLKGQPAIGINAVAAFTGICAGHNG